MKSPMRNTIFVFVLLSTPPALQAAELWSTLPGTNTRNELEYIQRGEMIYKPLPGTRTPDRGSEDRWIIRDNKVYRAIPGTNVPDYGSRKYIIK